MKRNIQEPIGMGKITSKKGMPFYEGTLPFADGDEVAIINVKDLTKLVNEEGSALLHFPQEMTEEFWEYSFEDDVCRMCARIPDEIAYGHGENGPHKLFLDRSFYSQNPKIYLFARWINVQEIIKNVK